MKKTLILIVLCAFIVPQIVLASWWNPIRWFNNWTFRSDTDLQTKILENKIVELENKLNSLATTTKLVLNSDTKTVLQPVDIKKQSSIIVSNQSKITANSGVGVPVQTPITSDVAKADVLSFIVGEPYVTQTIFNGYGGYEIRLHVSAVGDDFYIPMTTTDSTKGMTGVSYSIKGGEFKGVQTSKVVCNTFTQIMTPQGKYDYFCFVQKGKSLDITATVWLQNIEFGNYSVLFNKLGYFTKTNNSMNYYLLNKETESLYLN